VNSIAIARQMQVAWVFELLVLVASAFGCDRVELDVGAYEECILQSTLRANLCNSSALCVSQGRGSIVYFKHLRKSGKSYFIGNAGAIHAL
jgi:hypothetical protein